MVAAVRHNHSLHRVALQFGVSPATVLRWVRRAQGQRLDRVDWADRPKTPHHTRRSDPELETLVLQIRQDLRQHSDLGFYGAEAIRDELDGRGIQPLPAVRTINRILQRCGAFDGQRRQRRPPPPAGWYLPDLAARRVDLDSFDVVEGLVIKDGPQVEVLNGVSLHGGLIASWPRGQTVTAAFIVDCLVEHWQEFGLPAYAQFDNDTIFQGTHAHPDVIGRVSRLCLSLKVTPVFVPPREMGFQAAIEGFNGSWQSRVWARFVYEDLSQLQERSARHITALRRHRAARLEAAPGRRPFPPAWKLDLQTLVRGRLIYLRRTNATGGVEVLGRSFEVDQHWCNRLVRVEADLKAGRLRFYRLRRREPMDQPLLKEIRHRIPDRGLRE
jgi:transposase-like protein